METTRLSLLLRIPELSKSHVKMLDPGKVCDKVRKMSQDGKDRLLILTDFDKTLTKPKIGDINLSSIGSIFILDYLCSLSDQFEEEGGDIIVEIIKLMSDTVTPYHDQTRLKIVDDTMRRLNNSLRLVPLKSNASIANEVAKNKSFVLRDGVKDTLFMTNENEIPFVILSGGFGDPIYALLKAENVYCSNVHIIANHFAFIDGYIDGFAYEPVHPYNKHLQFLKSDFCDKGVPKRTNIILLGDSMTDAHMTDGVPDTTTVLKIGFYNKSLNFEGSEEDFLGMFDMVIVEDDSVEVINGIIKFLISNVTTEHYSAL